MVFCHGSPRKLIQKGKILISVLHSPGKTIPPQASLLSFSGGKRKSQHIYNSPNQIPPPLFPSCIFQYSQLHKPALIPTRLIHLPLFWLLQEAVGSQISHSDSLLHKALNNFSHSWTFSSVTCKTTMHHHQNPHFIILTESSLYFSAFLKFGSLWEHCFLYHPLKCWLFSQPHASYHSAQQWGKYPLGSWLQILNQFPFIFPKNSSLKAHTIRQHIISSCCSHQQISSLLDSIFSFFGHSL